jgi:hypothetical protein
MWTRPKSGTWPRQDWKYRSHLSPSWDIHLRPSAGKAEASNEPAKPVLVRRPAIITFLALAETRRGRGTTMSLLTKLAGRYIPDTLSGRVGALAAIIRRDNRLIWHKRFRRSTDQGRGGSGKKGPVAPAHKVKALDEKAIGTQLLAPNCARSLGC